MAGTRSAFVRLHGCPVQCEWCDTKFTWAPGEIADRADFTAEEILRTIRTLSSASKTIPTNLVITGGEPMLYMHLLAMRSLFEQFSKMVDATIEVETSGYSKLIDGWVHQWGIISRLAPEPDRVTFNVSIKLPSARVKSPTYDANALFEAWWRAAYPRRKSRAQIVFKWAVLDQLDIHAMLEILCRRFGAIEDPAYHWLMPVTLGDPSKDAATALFVRNEALRLGMNFTGRMQVDLFGLEKRGV